MRVLIYGNKMFSYDMLWGFLQAGCETSVVSANNAEQMERVLKDFGADLLITLGAPLELKQDIMAYLGARRPSGITHIHWDTDGISSTYYLSKSGDGIEMDVIYASKPDLVLTMCPEMCEFVKLKHIACEIMYYAYSPMFHHPMAELDAKEEKISLVGSSYATFYPFHPEHFRYTSLKILLKPLLEKGYAVHLYGDNAYPPLIKRVLGIEVRPENYHGPLPYDRTCAVYNSSFFNITTQNHAQTITKRTFEILGSGGFALSSDNMEIRKLFTPERDLVVSSSPEQTLELADYYLNNKDKWRDVRKNGQLSVKNHTYKQRAEYILEQYRVLTT
jgi:spore maturation protein CgeB